METKFKIGKEVFFMKYAEPSKGIVKGYSAIVGEVETSSTNKKTGTEEKPHIVYCIDSYTNIDEEKCFETKEELQADLFSKF